MMGGCDLNKCSHWIGNAIDKLSPKLTAAPNSMIFSDRDGGSGWKWSYAFDNWHAFHKNSNLQTQLFSVIEMGALVKRGVDGGIARVNSANMTCRCCVHQSLLTKLDSIAVSIFATSHKTCPDIKRREMREPKIAFFSIVEKHEIQFLKIIVQ